MKRILIVAGSLALAGSLVACNPSSEFGKISVGVSNVLKGADNALARLAAEVHSVECIPVLADLASKRLAAQGCTNVTVHRGDGSLGWPPAAPYDAIVVTAAGPEVPAALKAQLKLGGRLVMPVGERHGPQDLLRLTRNSEHGEQRELLLPVRFVPLTGAQGWPG